MGKEERGGRENGDGGVKREKVKEGGGRMGEKCICRRSDRTKR